VIAPFVMSRAEAGRRGKRADAAQPSLDTWTSTTRMNTSGTWATPSSGWGAHGAAGWVQPLKDRLYGQGAAPVLAALTALTPETDEAVEAVRVALGYVTTHAARMDYPRFVARQLPIGSGAVESTCKVLIAARAKGAGMRWSRTGLQAITSLRALPARPPPSTPDRGRGGACPASRPRATTDRPGGGHPTRCASGHGAPSAPDAAASPAPLPPPSRPLCLSSLF